MIYDFRCMIYDFLPTNKMWGINNPRRYPLPLSHQYQLLDFRLPVRNPIVFLLNTKSSLSNLKVFTSSSVIVWMAALVRLDFAKAAKRRF